MDVAGGAFGRVYPAGAERVKAGTALRVRAFSLANRDNLDEMTMSPCRLSRLRACARTSFAAGALVLSGVVFAVVLFEVALRLAAFSYPSFFRADALTGSWHREHAEGWYQQEGRAYVRINSAGLRDREHDLVKPANTFRVAILGDSYAEAMQVDVENTFWSILEGRVNACRAAGDRHVEVINFGVSGYSPGQQLLSLERVWPYAPDLVMLAFFSGNDIRDNDILLAGGYPRPYFRVQNGALTLDESFRDSFVYRLKASRPWRWLQAASDYVRVIQFVNKGLNVISARARVGSRMRADNVASEIGLDDRIYVEPTPAWQRAWDVTETILLRIRDEVVRRRARFMLVTLTNSIQVHPNAVIRAQVSERLGVGDLLYPERRLIALAQRARIDSLVLAPIMLAYAEKHQVFLHGFPNLQAGAGHWNEHGHRVAGEAIASYLCSRGLR